MMPEGYRKYYPAAAAVAVLLLAYLTFFPVRETEFVLVTQFGRPIRTITEAGLGAKWPYQTAIYFDRRLRAYNPRPSVFLSSVPVREPEFVLVTQFGRPIRTISYAVSR